MHASSLSWIYLEMFGIRYWGLYLLPKSGLEAHTTGTIPFDSVQD
ncbi:MAG: hypothetical protein QGF78_06905 [Candidatus Bathyarchaeota archaeon]|nr:hypothetical protein [Candidatus Bathyarchaeota archaeon]